MAYDVKNSLKSFDTKRTEAVEWFSRELSVVRTGRATPALLDLVQVESYGARVPIVQIGSVGNEDARTLRISLWDKKQIKDVERALVEADLGVSVMSDDSGIRVIFPELSSERRVQLLKLAKAKYEDARVTLRKVRDEIMKELDQKMKEGDIGEDEKFRAREEVQKRIDTTNATFDEMLARKETEIGH